MSGPYRSYWGACENKSHAPLTIVVECHPDAGPDATMPDPASADDGWDGFGLTCPVCGDTVPGGFEGADETTTWERADKARGAVGFRERLTMADYVRGYADTVFGEARLGRQRADLHALADKMGALSERDADGDLVAEAREYVAKGRTAREAG